MNSNKWNSYCRYMKNSNDDMWNRDFIMGDFIKKVHVIMISDSMQFVIHKNLNLNFHYSISDEKRLKMIVAFCKFSGIEVRVYKNDTSYEDINEVVVLNKFKQSDIELYYKRLQAHKVMEILKKKGVRAKKRNTVGWSIAPSGSYAQGWRRPHPELNPFAKNGKLNKEGFNIGFPFELKQSMAEGLLVSSQILKRLLKDKRTLFPSKQRNVEFSKELSEILGITENIYFEGGTIQCYYNDFEMHLDAENCDKNGYQYSTVLSTIIQGVRVAWICYTRKRAGKYMERKRKALWQKKIADQT